MLNCSYGNITILLFFMLAEHAEALTETGFVGPPRRQQPSTTPQASTTNFTSSERSRVFLSTQAGFARVSWAMRAGGRPQRMDASWNSSAICRA